MRCKKVSEIPKEHIKSKIIMKKSLNKILQGYQLFRKKYTEGTLSIMQFLSAQGQDPDVMIVSCCDSRVDPALILQCDPGDLFVVRNVANIVPPFENDEAHHDTSAALEFGVSLLKVKHLILLGHSQCGGIKALLNIENLDQKDSIRNWVSLINTDGFDKSNPDLCAQSALLQSHKNCMTFPWIADKVAAQELMIHLWFFDIKTGQIFCHDEETGEYIHLTNHSRYHAAKFK